MEQIKAYEWFFPKNCSQTETFNKDQKYQTADFPQNTTHNSPPGIQSTSQSGSRVQIRPDFSTSELLQVEAAFTISAHNKNGLKGNYTLHFYIYVWMNTVKGV